MLWFARGAMEDGRTQGLTAAERIYAAAVRVYRAALTAEMRWASAESRTWTAVVLAALEAARAGLHTGSCVASEEAATASEALADRLVGALAFAQPTGWADGAGKAPLRKHDE